MTKRTQFVRYLTQRTKHSTVDDALNTICTVHYAMHTICTVDEATLTNCTVDDAT